MTMWPTDWVPLIFIVGVVVAVCLSRGEPDVDGSVQPGPVPAGVLHDRTGVADVDRDGNGYAASRWAETLTRWLNHPSAVVALGLLALGVVLVLALRPRGPRG